jgi:hypothetical protein
MLALGHKGDSRLPSDKAILFGIPTAQHNGASRLPPSLCKLTEGLGQLDEYSRSWK